MKPNGYSRKQIWLHWIVFLLVVQQFVFNDYIKQAWITYVKTNEFQFNLLIALHVLGGILIALLVIWRLAIRIKRGAPASPEGDSALQKGLAHATHYTLYLLLLLMPISGAAAWFLDVQQAATTHFYLKFAVIALVSFIFLQHFITNTWSRTT